MAPGRQHKFYAPSLPLAAHKVLVVLIAIFFRSVLLFDYQCFII